MPTVGQRLDSFPGRGSNDAPAAEAVTARALGVKPQLRVIEGGNQRDVREPLEKSQPEQGKEKANG